MNADQSTDHKPWATCRALSIFHSVILHLTAVLAVICLTVKPVTAHESGSNAQFGLGPFHIRSQSPIHTPRLTPIPRVPERIVSGHFQVWGGGTWTNIWAEDKRYFLDYEMLNLDAELRYGVSPRLLIALGYNYRSYFGGAMDGFIQGFHDALDIEQQ